MLLMITIEDMRSRSVHWFWFPALAIGLAALRGQQGQSIKEIGSSLAITFSFLAVQLLLVTAYFSVKHRQLVNIANGMLGWGDILFLLSVAFYMPILHYMAFYIISLIIVLLASFIYMQISGKKQLAIPLAGGQAILFALLLICSWLLPACDLTNDEALIHLLML
ncbi:hypothetical protein KHS38_13300 [Mucilaginibacter sp. Bleaf8]|uniref:hypothetical protein n=1 Tax=Mucilaginibacter sp. Bleaf8 TaxID=2834430 RepID=UPI001BD09ED1|nr:hypothetical protein [Mucilaginibacter sp. Bleaf8]MBS7565382.1 hypothetical protein [Mucilaginibacter sp. Bleaf8]